MTYPENHPMRITGVAELVVSSAFVMSEVLRVIEEAGGPQYEKLRECVEAGEQAVLTVRVLPDKTGSVIELITQEEGALSLTRHAIIRILKNTGGALN